MRRPARTSTDCRSAPEQKPLGDDSGELELVLGRNSSIENFRGEFCSRVTGRSVELDDGPHAGPLLGTRLVRARARVAAWIRGARPGGCPACQFSRFSIRTTTSSPTALPIARRTDALTGSR